jgi:hydrogenase maturation factor
MTVKSNLSGAFTCARYAFAPNYYQYCGPDTRGEFGEYLKAQVSDGGLVESLSKFESLYPYLNAIAHANGLADPFDPRVVNAYWLGNSLLETISPQDTYLTLKQAQKLSKRLSIKNLNLVLGKIDRHPRLHHSFHVFDVFTQKGHPTLSHTVETMDQCRISWGQIINTKSEVRNPKQIINSNFKIEIKTQKLIYNNGKLSFKPITREIMVIEPELGKKLRVGDWVSVHWGFVCDKLNESQVKNLQKYTLHHLRLANGTI